MPFVKEKPIKEFAKTSKGLQEDAPYLTASTLLSDAPRLSSTAQRTPKSSHISCSLKHQRFFPEKRPEHDPKKSENFTRQNIWLVISYPVLKDKVVVLETPKPTTKNRKFGFTFSSGLNSSQRAYFGK